MKHFNVHIARCLFVILLGFSIQDSLFAQLSGNYTINPKISVSATNYLNWASAVGDLLSGTRTDGGTAQGPGVNAAVVFTVYDTFYNTQVSITAITGASATKTITFQGTSDSSKCILRYASGSAATDDWVLKLDGAKYITFKKIGFQRTGSSSYYTVVQLLNDANRNTFTNCWFKTNKVPSTSSAGWTTGVGAHICYTGHADSVVINQNRFIYGYNGIYSGNTTTCYGTTISKNVFDTAGCIGVYVTYQTGMKLTGNTFNMGDFGPSTGHYVSYATRIETSPAVTITGNKMFMKATNGSVLRAMVFVSVNASASDPSLINNNFVVNYGGGSSTSAISMYGVSYMEICNNNFLVTSSLTAGAIIHENPTYTNSYVKISNNNLINKGNGMIYDLASATHTGFDTVNYNNYYLVGSSFGNVAGTAYSSLSAWKTGTSFDANSLYSDPGYVNNLDLHVSNIGINGKALPYWRVTKDIDGDTRDATYPDIGADEFFPVANDAGISSLDSPSVFCAGVKNVKVTFQNFGADTLKNLYIYWKINGTSQTTYTFSGSIPPGTSSGSVNLGSFNFVQNVAYNFKIWAASPNGQNDGNHSNDTLSVTRYAAMSGAYTISPTGSSNDFLSINNAITALTNRGVCGAVTFNIANGTYNEQLTFPQFPGMGASNPITFQSASGDSSKVLVTLPSTSATGTNNACIQLNGGDYLTFKGMSFQRTGTNAYAQVVHILNGSNYNTFSNCQLLGISSSSTTANNIWSDQGTDNNNVFKNNYVYMGYYNMQYLGTATAYESGTVVEGNVFEGAYSNAVQIGYNNNVVVRKNIFKNSTNAGTYDIQLMDCDNQIEVSNNSFTNVNNTDALLLTNCNATVANPGMIYNNTFVKSTGNAIDLDAVDYQYVVFNSIRSTGTNGIYTSTSTSSNIVLKNNNIYMTTGNALYISLSGQVSASNRNNYYCTGSNFIYWGSSFSTLQGLIASTKKDSNSLTVDPLFFSNTNLHVKNAALKNAGEPIKNISTDMDGETRNATNPDIGADEFERMPNDAGIVSVTRPLSTECEGVLNVAVVVKNFGKDTLKRVQIDWKVNGVKQDSVIWTGNLLSNSQDTVSLGSYNFKGITSPSIWASTILPNNKTDDITLNDALTVTKSISPKPNASAGNDASVCLGDAIIIGPSSQIGYSYKWYDATNTIIGTTSQISVKPSTPSIYVLEVKNINTGCSNLDSINIGVKALPTVFAGNDTTICKGSSVKIGTAAQSGFNYSWTSIPPGFNTIVASPVVTPSKTTTYILKKSQNTTGCSAYDSVSITVVPRSNPKIIADTIVCQGNQTYFSTAFTSGNTYLWQLTLGQLLGGQGTDSILVDWQTAGDGKVKVFETTPFNCIDSSIVNVHVILKPDAKMVINGRCSGRKVSFYDSSQYGVSRVWDFGDMVNSSLQNPDHIYQNSGSYTVKLHVFGPQGCSDSTSQTITITDPPVAGFTFDNEVCEGDTVIFANNSTNASSYLWDFGNSNTSTLFNPATSYLSTGKYDIKLVAYGTSCNDSIVNKIDIMPNPVADFDFGLLASLVLCTDYSTISSGTIVSWNWDFGDGDTSTQQNPNHRYKTSGYKTIKLCVISASGCFNCKTRTFYLNSIRENVNQNMIMINPNPGFGIFTLSSAVIIDEIEIYDMLGNQILKLKPFKTQFNIDLTNYPKGLYHAKINSGNKVTDIKLIRQ